MGVVRSPALIYGGAVTEKADHFSSTTWLRGPRWSSSGELAIYDGQLSTCADLFTPAPLNAPNSHNLGRYRWTYVSRTCAIRKWLIKRRISAARCNRYFGIKYADLSQVQVVISREKSARRRDDEDTSFSIWIFIYIIYIYIIFIYIYIFMEKNI